MIVGLRAQVKPGESVLLCLLLCVCISEAINDMVGVNRLRRYRRVALPFYEPQCHWESLCRSGASKAAPGGDEAEFSFAAVEKSVEHWWNRRPQTAHAGAANCGAGEGGAYGTVQYCTVL